MREPCFSWFLPSIRCCVEWSAVHSSLFLCFGISCDGGLRRIQDVSLLQEQSVLVEKKAVKKKILC